MARNYKGLQASMDPASVADNRRRVRGELRRVAFLPSVIRAEYCGGYRIHVTFNDDSEKTIDFREWLKGPVFEPLKAPNRFRTFFLDGGTVAWPNGADIAPETLYEYRESRKRPNGAMQPMAQETRRT
jgi:hypothetical protein